MGGRCQMPTRVLQQSDSFRTVHFKRKHVLLPRIIFQIEELLAIRIEIENKLESAILHSHQPATFSCTGVHWIRASSDRLGYGELPTFSLLHFAPVAVPRELRGCLDSHRIEN